MTDPHRNDRVVVLGLVAAGLAWAGGVVALAVVSAPTAIVVAAALAQLVMLTAGAVIVVRSDVPLLGWLLVATGSTVMYWTALQAWAPDTIGAGTGTLVAIAHSIAPLSVVPFLIALAIFPAGRARTRLERAVVGIALVGGLGSVGLMVAWSLGLLGGQWSTWRGVFEAVILATVLGTIVNHVLAYRSRPRVERQQVKYFALVLMVGIVQIPMSYLDVPLGADLDAVMPGLISFTILLAITRYRLYEIDRIVSRTVGYALVVALLLGLGVGTLALLTTVLPTRGRLVTVGVTVLVVAVSGPVRRRVLDIVDRRFDRTRYVAQQVVADFGRAVADETDLDALRDRLDEVLRTTLAPATVAVWEPSR